MTPEADTYGARYQRRWSKTAVGVALLTLAATGARQGADPVSVIFGALINAAVLGSLVNLVVAVFPSRRSA